MSRPSEASGPAQTLELLEQARAGDTRAWDRLCECYGDDLLRRVRARLGSELRSREESMDVLQSVWREAIGSLQRFEYRGEDSFLAWLATLLRNKLADRAQHARAVKRGGGVPSPTASVAEHALSTRPAAAPGPVTQAERDEEHDRLLLAIERLPSDQQRLVRWALLEGLPTREIAARLDLGEDAARMRVVRAEARLTAEFLRLDRGAGRAVPGAQR